MSFNSRIPYATFIKNKKVLENNQKVIYIKKDVKKNGTKIPKEVSIISKNAFSSADMTSITIPSNVTELEDSAFESSVITTLKIPSTVKTIGRSAFAYNKELKEVTLPEGMTVVLESCFMNCAQLEKVNLPQSLQFIGDNAFENCHLKEVKVPEQCTLRQNCFNSNKFLVKVTLKGISNVPPTAFANCEILKNVEVDANLKEIGDNAFESCTNLENFNFTENIEYIGSSAFQACEKLKTAVLQKKVKFIGDFAFSGCINLEEVVVENENAYIGLGVIAKCDNLKTIELTKYHKNVQIEVTENEFKTLNKVGLKLDEKLIEKVTNRDEIRDKLNQPDFTKVNTINNFYDQNITEIDLKPSVEVIGGNGFSAGELTSLFIPSSLVLSDTVSVTNCSNLENIVFPNYLNSFTPNPLAEQNLTQIKLPNGVTRINHKTFYYCKIEEIELPNGVKEVEDGAFDSCVKLSKIVLPQTVTQITEKFAVKCYNLTEIVVSDNKILDVAKILKLNQNTSEELTSIPSDITEINSNLNLD
ncbi:hypothetical protein EIN_298900 [Entamoeba invadens IP1]|uniref:Leucine rich repeat containing protein BspA family protein n=1 Tax=Entamoeba invadens IP1 TaxID=370355 RepID=L7FMZ3_ENTIV|nr:hypothetical protein EIN_298900 [Entamoeba invadens IP1]ELP92359.1 hypothetical protein EIN_298900 [Entamoeba invadens IP1]|eukprot:XP_004259130.1 hypothetical protein EIN_298900 [Entamoeba invadens IP1]